MPTYSAARGSAGREQDLASQLGALLEQHDPMAPERGHASRFQPRHAAPDDHDLPRRRRRADLTQLGLTTRCRVLDAGDRLALIDPVDAAFVRSHAGPDVVEPTFASLARQVGVGDQRARHPDDVHLAIGDDLLGVPRIDDARRVEDRHPGDRLLDEPGQRHEEAGVKAHVRHHGGLERVRVSAAADDREEVDQAGGGEPAGDGRQIRGGQPARSALIAGDARADDEVTADLPANLAQHVHPEAHPVLQASAVRVEPMVEQRRPELIDEVVVRHGELDPVETPVATPPRRIAEGGDQLGDLLRFQLVRDLAMDALRNLRGRQEDATRLRIRLRAPAEVRELREHETVVAVHGIRERAIGRDDGVVVVGDLLPRRGRRRWVNAGGSAEDRERAAAAGLGLVIAPQPFRRPPVLGHGLGVTG